MEAINIVHLIVINYVSMYSSQVMPATIAVSLIIGISVLQ